MHFVIENKCEMSTEYEESSYDASCYLGKKRIFPSPTSGEDRTEVELGLIENEVGSSASENKELTGERYNPPTKKNCLPFPSTGVLDDAIVKEEMDISSCVDEEVEGDLILNKEMNLSESQMRALNAIMSRKSIFFTGPAGDINSEDFNFNLLTISCRFGEKFHT